MIADRVEDILAQLAERGIRVELAPGDHIDLVGAIGEIDLCEKEQLRARKPEIRAFLVQRSLAHPARLTGASTVHEGEARSEFEELGLPQPAPDLEAIGPAAMAELVEQAPRPVAPFEVRPGERVIDVDRYVRGLVAELRRDPGLRAPAPTATLAMGRAYLRQAWGG